jgi:N-acetylmuramoyl-L-alanine amidase
MAPARLSALRLALCASLAGGLLAPAAAVLAARRPSELARPDRTLYTEAQSALVRLKASPTRLARRAEWERVALAFRKVVLSYPRSGYCDNALLAAGDLYREMSRRFKTPRDAVEAIRNYNLLVAEYPSSRLGEQALYNVFEMARGAGDARRTTSAAREYLEAYPESRRAATVKQAARPKPQSRPSKPATTGRSAAPVEVAADPDSLPTPPPPGLTQVFNLRFWSGASSTRVVLDLEKEVPYTVDRLTNPERVFVDLPRTRLHPNLKDRAFPVGDGLLEQVRIGQNRADVVRVVLDVDSVKNQTVFYLADPVRLVIDIRGVETRVADAGSPPSATPPQPPAPSVRQTPARVPAPAATPTPAATAVPPPTPAATPARPGSLPPPPQAAPTPAPTPLPAPTPAPDQIADRRRVADLAPNVPAPPPTTLPSRPKTDVVLEGTGTRIPPRQPSPSPSPTPALAKATPAPAAPEANRSGGYSLARQLGLHARRIVIDAGHGGHDPGTIGPAGLMEKDLVLDVALRLEKLVRSQLRADVVLTRSTDVFVPLEERTAIANQQDADLFLSIHANASRNRTARGIETYFLSFAKNPHAEEVAARENAISEATLKDLQTLVKAITLNSKIDESRDFAAAIQEALVANLREIDPKLPDRGVHTAPFYVLIGASMPSILAEIAFVSHPGEEKRLKSPAHRDRIAQSLFVGVRRYLESLNRTQTRQLTQGPRRTPPLTAPAPKATVAKKGKKR